MRIFFTGVPTKEEVELFLKNHRYSLLNNLELRKSILMLNKSNLVLSSKKNVLKPKDHNIFEDEFYKTVLKNTKENSGYKTIKAFYKKNVTYYPKKNKDNQIKVTFTEDNIVKPHNDELIKSILNIKKKENIKLKKRKKKCVFIQHFIIE